MVQVNKSKFDKDVTSLVLFASDSAHEEQWYTLGETLLLASFYLSIRVDFKVLNADSEIILNFDGGTAEVSGNDEALAVFGQHYSLFLDAQRQVSA